MQNDPHTKASTQDRKYTERLIRERNIWWKNIIDVQIPYRWNLRRLNPGFVLEIGCGTGRQLKNLGGHGVGVDHNSDSIQAARNAGYEAFTPDGFWASKYAKSPGFDSLLLSHFVEHMKPEEAVAIIRPYVPLLKEHGKLILFTPQEAGFRSDRTHVQFADFDVLRKIAADLGFKTLQQFSFPFPRPVGRIFRFNEFVMVCIRKAETAGT